MPRAGLDADAIVDAAARVADADGLPAVTVARVATDLDVRPPSLYAHLGGLDDLRRRLALRGVRELTSTLQQAAPGRAGLDALTAIAHAYRAFAHSHPGIYAALQRAPDPADSEATAAAAQAVRVFTAVLRGYGLEGDQAIHATRIVRSTLHGFVTLEHSGGFGLPLDLNESFASLIATLDRGLK